MFTIAGLAGFIWAASGTRFASDFSNDPLGPRWERAALLVASMGLGGLMVCLTRDRSDSTSADESASEIEPPGD
jgi:hypothetical protein